MKTFNDYAEEGSIVQETGDIAAQSAKRDMMVESNPTINSNDEQEQEQAVREGLRRFLNDNDDGLPTPHGDDEEQWRKRRKRFNEEIANEIVSQWRDEGYEMGVEDLYAHAVVQQFEKGDSVMFDYGADGDESDDDIEDDNNDDGVDDVELGNTNDAPQRARKTIKPKKGVAMTSFDDIMHEKVDVEPLNLSQKTTCPKCGGEKLEAEQKSGVSKHCCCQNGSVLDVADQPMPFRSLDRSSTDPKIVAEIKLRDLLRNEETQTPQRQVQYAQAQHLHQYARGFNNQFAFSSAVAKPILGTARPPFQGNYVPMVIMQGDLNHFVEDIRGNQEEPQFMQLVQVNTKVPMTHL